MYMCTMAFRRERHSGALPRTGTMRHGKRRGRKSGKRRGRKSGKRRGTKNVRAGVNGSRTKIVRASIVYSRAGEKHAKIVTTKMRNACDTICAKLWSETRSRRKSGSKKSRRGESETKSQSSSVERSEWYGRGRPYLHYR